MKQIPDVAPKVKCGFCGLVMHVSEWSGGHQYLHGGAKSWEFTPAQMVSKSKKKK